MDQQTSENEEKVEVKKAESQEQDESGQKTAEVESIVSENKNSEVSENETEVSELDKVQAELDEQKKKYVYLAAEFENTKRRLQKEKESLAKFGNESLLNDLVKVVDNLDRTMKALEGKEDPATKNIVIGIEMVHKQFLETLQAHGLKKLESLGKEFDPNFHEAMAEEEVEGSEPNKIVNVFEEAYELNGRLLRAAKVIVSK